MLTHRTPHHFWHDFVALWNDGESYATISRNTPISASGAVTFGA